eukprot:2026167-Rhodomonas_salina.2
MSTPGTPATSTKGKEKHKLPTTSEQSEQDRPSKVAKKLASKESEQDRLSGAVAKQQTCEESHASFQAFVDTLPGAIMHPSLNCAVQLCLVCGDRERTIIVAGPFRVVVIDSMELSCRMQFPDEQAQPVHLGGLRRWLRTVLAQQPEGHDRKRDRVSYYSSSGAGEMRRSSGLYKNLRKEQAFRRSQDGQSGPRVPLGRRWRPGQHDCHLRKHSAPERSLCGARGHHVCPPSHPPPSLLCLSPVSPPSLLCLSPVSPPSLLRLFSLLTSSLLILPSPLSSLSLSSAMWNKAEGSNTEPLPRIVGWSPEDYSRSEAIAKNEKMNDGRQRHAHFLHFASTTPQQLNTSDDLTRLVPLFPPADWDQGEAWLWASRYDYWRPGGDSLVLGQLSGL